VKIVTFDAIFVGFCVVV